MQINIPSSHNHLSNFHIYDEMTNFINMIEQKIGILNQVFFSICLVPINYYDTNDELLNHGGPCGYVGWSGDDNTKKDNYSRDMETLYIRFETSKEWLQQNKDKLENLKVSPSNNKYGVFPIWKASHIRNEIKTKVKYGLYKKPGFDDIF
jgi:hypothetical protein